MQLEELGRRHVALLADAEQALREAAVGVEEPDLEQLLKTLRAFACEEQCILSFVQDDADAGSFTRRCSLSGNLLRTLQKNEQIASGMAASLFRSSYSPISAAVSADPCGYESVSHFDDATSAMKLSLLEEASKQQMDRPMKRLLLSMQAQIRTDREAVMLQALERKMQAMRPTWGRCHTNFPFLASPIPCMGSLHWFRVQGSGVRG